ncbi:DUF1207 domain-containing protein [Candidatus Odyssella thessalonicensis]|uniref:DUF1207 domain-containing protein n=1 Tax=Candidatus Odyssella thessalonicensis TaxID=84647 RepID=UPI000225B930|nr:DUF1207 domain-containing protein [Candidatus Odyssella thessalonicensis]
MVALRITKMTKISVFSLLIHTSLATSTFAYSEAYLAGYVDAIIAEVLPEEEIRYHINGNHLTLVIMNSELDPSAQDQLVSRLSQSERFASIKVHSNNPNVLTDSSPPSSIRKVSVSKSKERIEILPNGAIYDTPVADPKWPQFTAGFQRHFKNVYGKNIFELAFGENLALVRYRTAKLIYEIGVQAGLTGLMDFTKSPSRLVNSDYFVGLGLSIVYDKKWQNLIQFSHLSSHIGDEYIISKPRYLDKRINLSYETLKWYTAYKFNSFRPYIGVGYLVHKDPSSVKPLTFDIGFDYISEQKILWDKARFVLGANSFFWSETKFSPRFNVSTGIQMDNPVWAGRKLKFLINYTNGNSRHGQFYKKRENYLGLSINISN